MKTWTRITVLAFLAANSPAAVRAGDADDVRGAEIAFARAFADRDAGRFFSFVAEDARFFSATRVLSGKAAVIAGWSKYLQDARAPFRWQPERIETNAGGDLAVSSGPVFDPSGAQISNFFSIWQKQKDGSWKVLFDGPGSCVEEKKP
jgi:ketosteroid isomerase-like protein